MARSPPALAVLAALLLASLAPTGAAQPSRDLTTLTLHSGSPNWMDEDADNGDDGGGVLLDSTGQIGDEPTGIAFPLTPPLDADLALAAQPVDATIVLGAAFLGGAVPSTVPGPVTVTITLAAGATTIATGTAEGMLPDGVATEQSTFTFSMAPTATSIAKADNLVLTVDVSSTAPTGPFFLDTGGSSFLTLPIASAPAAGGLSLATGKASATAAAGSAAGYNLTVSGAAGSNFTLAAVGLPSGFVATFTPASGTLSSDSASVALSVSSPSSAAARAYAFNATLSSGGTTAASVALTLTVTAASSSSTSSTTSTSTTSSSTSASASDTTSSSTAAADDESKDSPGAALPLAALAIVALALLARRRLA